MIAKLPDILFRYDGDDGAECTIFQNISRRFYLQCYHFIFGRFYYVTLSFSSQHAKTYSRRRSSDEACYERHHHRIHEDKIYRDDVLPLRPRPPGSRRPNYFARKSRQRIA